MAGVRAFVALGANLGDALTTLTQAVHDLNRLPQTHLVQVSSLYGTAPIDSSGPDYLNAVAEIATGLGASELLAHLQALENAAGRERPYPNAPRTLDLDVLLFDDQVINTPTLVVPHPRMTQRAFVLVPLAEIFPAGVSQDHLAAVQGQAIHPLGRFAGLPGGQKK